MSECSRCGQCCRYINFGLANNLKAEAREYLMAKGAYIDQGFMVLDHTCPNLKEGVWIDDPGYEFESEGAPLLKHGHIGSICLIHDHKPKLCRQFDGRRYINHTLYYVPEGCSMVK